MRRQSLGRHTVESSRVKLQNSIAERRWRRTGSNGKWQEVTGDDNFAQQVGRIVFRQCKHMYVCIMCVHIHRAVWTEYSLRFRICIRFFRVGLEMILQWGDRSRWAGEQSLLTGLLGCRCTDNWEISGIQPPLRTVVHKSVFQILEIALWSPKNARKNVESQEGPEQERQWMILDDSGSQWMTMVKLQIEASKERTAVQLLFLNQFDSNEGHFFIGSGAIGICPPRKRQPACKISS